MKKERDEEQKPLFEVWLAAYNSRLVQVAQGSAEAKAPVQGQSSEEGSQPEPPAGSKA